MRNPFRSCFFLIMTQVLNGGYVNSTSYAYSGVFVIKLKFQFPKYKLGIFGHSQIILDNSIPTAMQNWKFEFFYNRVSKRDFLKIHLFLSLLEKKTDLNLTRHLKNAKKLYEMPSIICIKHLCPIYVHSFLTNTNRCYFLHILKIDGLY